VDKKDLPDLEGLRAAAVLVKAIKIISDYPDMVDNLARIGDEIEEYHRVCGILAEENARQEKILHALKSEHEDILKDLRLLNTVKARTRHGKDTEIFC